MPRIEVHPELLSAGGDRQRAMAAGLHEVEERLRAAVAQAAGAAGDGHAAAAMASFGRIWSSELEDLSGWVGRLGGNLAAAGHAYSVTDHSVIPGTPGR